MDGGVRARHRVLGEIDGVVFLATSICNRDFTAVKMAHEWIKANGSCTR